MYKTGHSRVLTWSGTITGTQVASFAGRNLVPTNPDDPPLIVPSALGYFSVAAGGWTITITPIARTTSGTFLNQVGYKVEISGGTLGNTGTASVDVFTSASNNYNSNEVRTYSYPLNLEWSISCPVTEWFEEVTPNQPWFDSIPDAPANTTARFFLKETEGGHSSASCGGASLASGSLSGTIDRSMVVSLGVSATAKDTGTSEFAATITDGPCDYTVPDTAESSYSGTLGDASATASGEASISITAASAQTINASASSILDGDREYDAAGVIRMMDDAYSDSVGVDVGGHVGGSITASGGTWSAGGAQKRYALTANAEGITNAVNVNEHSPLSATLLQSDLLTNGDEPKNRRCLWRGWLVPGIGISQDATYSLVDNEDAPSSWDEDTTTSGGVATLSSSAKLTFTPKVSALSYRFVRFQVRSVGAANVLLSLTIPANTITDDDRHDVSGGGSVEYIDSYTGGEESDKAWNFTTAGSGTWTTITLDLCSPDNLSDTTDGQDSRFPIPSRMPLFYGVSRIHYLQFGGVPSGATDIEIKDIAFVMLSEYPQFDCLPTFYPNSGRVISGQFVMNSEWDTDSAKWRADELLDGGTLQERYQRRFFASRTDGKAAIEESDFGYTKTTTTDGTTSWSFGGTSIAGLAGQINAIDTATVVPPVGSTPRVTAPQIRYPGIHATVSTPSPDASIYIHDGYLNSSLSATCIGGAGAWFDRASGWHYALNRQDNVPVQTLYTKIDWYAGCGDVFAHASAEGSDRSGPIILKAAVFLRASGQALAWGTTEGGTALSPIGGRTVRVEEDAVLRGDGTTDSTYGYVQTTDPYLQAVSVEELVTGSDGTEWSFTAPAASMIAAGSPERTIGIVPWCRRRTRGAFRVTIETVRRLSALAIDSPRQLLHAGNGKRISTYHLANYSLAFQSAEHESIEKWTSLCYDPRKSCLFCVAKMEDADTHKLYRSRDGGRHITEILTMDSKTAMVQTDSERSIIIALFQNASDDIIKRKISKDNGATWEAATNIVVDGSSAVVTGEVQGLDYDVIASVMVMVLKAVGADTATLLRSRDTGKNWVTVLP